MSVEQMQPAASSPTSKATTAYIFHTNLSDKLPGEDYWVYIAGEKHPLIEHTAESRSKARQEHPSLAHLEDSALTHYTPHPVHIPQGTVIRYTIRHQNKTNTLPGKSGIHHVDILVVPNETTGNNAMKNEQPGVKVKHSDYGSTAETLIRHHGDLNTKDPTIFNYIGEHMDQFKAPITYGLIQTLAGVMAAAGPPAVNSGWANYQPFDTDTMGQQQLLVPTADIIKAAGESMTAVQVSTKNDVRLKGTSWTLQEGTSVKSAGDNGEMAAGIYMPVSLKTRAGKDDHWTAALANTDPTYGLSTSIKVIDSGKRQVEITMTNTYIRCLAAYIQFVDADDNTMSTPDWQPDDGGVSAEIVADLQLDYNDLRFIGWISPIDTIFGVPDTKFPGTLTVRVTFPEGAVSANIYGCGLGTGKNQYPKSAVIGGVTTAILNFVLPSIFLGVGVAGQSWKPAYDLFNDPKFIAAALTIGITYFGGDFLYVGLADKKLNWVEFSTIGQIIFDKAVTKLLVWCEKQIVEGEIEDEIPFAGWAMVAVNIAADVAQMSQTIVEVVDSPWMISNNISTTITSTLTIHPDPGHHTFPAVPSGAKASYVAKMIYLDQNRPSITSSQVPLDPSSYPATLSASFENTLGGKVKFEVDFYIDNWTAGKATTGVLENDEQHTADITLYLVQVPIPLTSKSVYMHTAILGYSGQYSWMPQSSPPTGTLTNADNSQTGNAISEWMGLAISQRYGMVGLSWKAAGLGITDCSNHSDGQLYAFQNINIPGMDMNAVKFPTCALSGLSHLIYDSFPPKFKMDNGNFVLKNNQPVPDPQSPDLGNYYIDPRKSCNSEDIGNCLDNGGGYHLRKVILDDNSPSFNMSTGQNSYGRFPYFPDSVTLHPSKHIIGVSQKYCKMMITPLPDDPGLADNNIPLARTFAGKALNFNGSGGRAGLLFTPVAVTCSHDGTILVLEQVATGGFNLARIQAFDLNGNPVSCFSGNNGASPTLSLPTNATYLDLAAVGDNCSTFLFVLYYNNSGTATGDYNMTIYQYGKGAPAGNLLVTTPNIPAAKINVDMWHTLYTLNWQMTQDGSGHNAGPGAAPGRTVPSVSEWLPPIPK